MNHSLFITTMGFCAFLFSCAVTIPESDNTPPEFVFEILNGLPGGPIRITSSDDLSSKQLNLLRHSSYRFRYTGTDRGGLARLLLGVDWPTNFSDLSPVEIAVVTDGEVTRDMFWTGIRSRPVSGQMITGRISTILYNSTPSVVSMQFRFSANDYGGSMGPANIINNTLNVGIVDETQPLGMIDL